MNEARVWDHLAGSYDRTVRLFSKSYPQVRESLRRDLEGRGHVLEVAAGTGQFTSSLAETVTRLTATDVSAEMIRHLETKMAAQAIDNVDTAVMSAYELDVPDGSLDAIFCANALHVMETPDVALQEFHRALKSGGRLVLPTFCHGVDVWRRGLSRFLGLVSSFVAYTRFTPESLRQMVSSNGFDVQEVRLLPGAFPLAYLIAEVGSETGTDVTERLEKANGYITQYH